MEARQKPESDFEILNGKGESKGKKEPAQRTSRRTGPPDGAEPDGEQEQDNRWTMASAAKRTDGRSICHRAMSHILGR